MNLKIECVNEKECIYKQFAGACFSGCPLCATSVVDKRHPKDRANSVAYYYYRSTPDGEQDICIISAKNWSEAKSVAIVDMVGGELLAKGPVEAIVPSPHEGRVIIDESKCLRRATLLHQHIMWDADGNITHEVGQAVDSASPRVFSDAPDVYYDDWQPLNLRARAQGKEANAHGLKMANLEEATASTKWLASLPPYSSAHVQMDYHLDTGYIYAQDHTGSSMEDWTEYDDDRIIRIGCYHRPVTAQTIADDIANKVVEHRIGEEYRKRGHCMPID